MGAVPGAGPILTARARALLPLAIPALLVGIGSSLVLLAVSAVAEWLQADGLELVRHVLRCVEVARRAAIAASAGGIGEIRDVLARSRSVEDAGSGDNDRGRG